MALAWGTMLIFGASHQLLPVLVEGKLNSDKLAYLTFGLMAIGIPFLIYGFYVFNVGAPLKIGATMINLGVLCYLLNVISTAFKNNQKNIHAWFAITATIWLLTTTFLGLLLVFNFQTPLLTNNSVYYLAVHAHLGIIGWFLLMVIGLGSRLIPMFLISKYTNNKILWLIFALLNFALISFLGFYLSGAPTYLYYIPNVMGVAAILLFGRHCYKAYKIRIRKNVDQQVTTSLISIVLMLIPFIILIVTIGAIPKAYINRMVMLYGFTIFFGWITAIILGMTFKTMPFIIWNKVYHSKAHKGRTPAPKEIFNNKVYKIMQLCYLGDLPSLSLASYYSIK
ncbi:cytochrome C oxidase subunit I [Arachidicoccus ginsenosidivorans]|uniref:cytochrome C oxidase subunit I n=1 Tax=Arachidicoccus ginsenosidivorans TaxID=496057 RepID=UPI001CEF9C57|nr:cytochrome C oxidase subunit I [Arachidicoccus ginsenosidivorans]